MSVFDPEILKLLVCPQTKAELVLHGEQLVSTDGQTRRAYAIVTGIPDLLIAHARTLDLAEWESVMRSAGPPAK